VKSQKRRPRKTWNKTGTGKIQERHSKPKKFNSEIHTGGVGYVGATGHKSNTPERSENKHTRGAKTGWQNGARGKKSHHWKFVQKNTKKGKNAKPKTLHSGGNQVWARSNICVLGLLVGARGES